MYTLRIAFAEGCKRLNHWYFMWNTLFFAGIGLGCGLLANLSILGDLGLMVFMGAWSLTYDLSSEMGKYLNTLRPSIWHNKVSRQMSPRRTFELIARAALVLVMLLLWWGAVVTNDLRWLWLSFPFGLAAMVMPIGLYFCDPTARRAKPFP